MCTIIIIIVVVVVVVVVVVGWKVKVETPYIY
jgi:hypothetical protein